VLNQIGTVNVSTARPLVFDRYEGNRATGSFIIIDPATHFTAGAGMILNPLHHAAAIVKAPVSAAERLRISHGAPVRTPRRSTPSARPSRNCSRDPTAERSSTTRWPAQRPPCITSSFQAECVVLTHLLIDARPDIPVLFLDTVHHFAETYAYRDELAAQWTLNLVNLRAAEPKAGNYGARARRRAAHATRSARCSRRSSSTTSGYGATARTVALARESPGGRAVPAAERQDDPARQPAGRVDRSRRVGVREGPRDSPASALRVGLHEHRMRAVHDAAARSGQIRVQDAGRGRSWSADSHPGEVEIPNPKLQMPNPNVAWTGWDFLDLDLGIWDLGFPYFLIFS